MFSFKAGFPKFGSLLLNLSGQLENNRDLERDRNRKKREKKLLFFCKTAGYKQYFNKNTQIRGQPGGAVVKSARSASAARGSPVWIPGADTALLVKPCCGMCPTYKVEEDGHGC